MSLFRRPGLGRLHPAQNCARHAGARDGDARRHGGDLHRGRQPRRRSIRPGASSAPSPRRAWSAASPIGSRSPLCSATRSASRSRTPRSCRATRTGSATTLAQFLKDNFLTPSVVARRMKRVDVAGAIGRFLAQPPGEGRLRAGRLAPARRHPRGARPGETGRHGQGRGRRRGCARIDVAPLLGKTLEAAMTEERHVPMVDGIVTWAGRTLDANEDLIRDMVHQRAGWILRMAGLDEKLADAIVDGLRTPHHRHGGRSAPSAARQGRGRPRPPRRRPPVRSRDAGQGRGLEERDDRQSRGHRLARRRLGEQPRRPPQGRPRSRRRSGRQVRRGASPIGRDAAAGAAAQGRRSTSSPAAPPSARSPPTATASSPWSRTRSAPGTRAPSPTGSKTPSAATSNISGSTAPWSAAWSASSSTRSRWRSSITGCPHPSRSS